MLMAGERGISPERHAELMAQFRVSTNRSSSSTVYLKQLAGGDFGTSIITNQPVLKEFATLFPATIELSLCAIVIAVLFGLPAGMIAATKRGSVFDHTIMAGALTGYSMPISGGAFCSSSSFEIREVDGCRVACYHPRTY